MRTDTARMASATFAANRAQGAVKFGVHLQDGVTRRGILHESGSLRVRFPSPEAEGLSGVFVNTAGDLTLLLRVLEAASRFERRPSDGEIAAMLDSTRITSLFGLAI